MLFFNQEVSIMKSRIAQIRKQFNLSQEEFGKKLNMSRNYIWMIEKGERVPADRTIKDICREFGCNEVWLRTGDGDPFQEETRQETIMRFATQTVKGSDEFKKAFVSMLAKLDAEDWEALAKMFSKLSDETKK